MIEFKILHCLVKVELLTEACVRARKDNSGINWLDRVCKKS